MDRIDAVDDDSRTHRRRGWKCCAFPKHYTQLSFFEFRPGAFALRPNALWKFLFARTTLPDQFPASRLPVSFLSRGSRRCRPSQGIVLPLRRRAGWGRGLCAASPATKIGSLFNLSVISKLSHRHEFDDRCPAIHSSTALSSRITKVRETHRRALSSGTSVTTRPFVRGV